MLYFLPHKMIYAAKSVVKNVERKAKSFALKRKRELKVVQGWLVTLTSSRELRVNNTGQFQACARGKSTRVFQEFNTSETIYRTIK